ncbi:MAG TPA: polysaccharide deacetylase family protein [Kofleriaceae bacterium]|nr:polysaccharide deacetylase family protein [Kofleriaceae bacterium]
MATVLLALAACHYDADEADGAFYTWNERQVHCAIDIDTFARNDIASVEAGLDRARDRGEVLELYMHDPGRTVSWDALEDVLAAAQDRGLAFYTYADLARGTATPGGGVLLSMDDASLASWIEGVPLYAQYGARMTFFVSYYPQLSMGERAALHDLAAAGHAIEAHSVKHLRAPLYVEQKGLDAYLADEALPSIALLEADGFDVTTYAYPYGSRTGELDRALLRYVDLVRSVAFTWSGPADPCPE